MSIIYVLLPISLILGLVALAAYTWCVRSGQFDDPDKGALAPFLDAEDQPKE
jgi:cbb3-type cytochrome oxidase maturation protein